MLSTPSGHHFTVKGRLTRAGLGWRCTGGPRNHASATQGCKDRVAPCPPPAHILQAVSGKRLRCQNQKVFYMWDTHLPSLPHSPTKVTAGDQHSANFPPGNKAKGSSMSPPPPTSAPQLLSSWPGCLAPSSGHTRSCSVHSCRL